MDVRRFWKAVKAAGDWLLSDEGDLDVFVNLFAHGTIGSLRTGSMGKAWEIEFMRLVRERGFECTDVSKRNLPHDVIVEVGEGSLRVQCKWLSKPTGSIAPRGRDRDGKRAYRVDDFEVLAVCVGNTFDNYCLIPAEQLESWDGRLVTTLRDHHWFFKQRWEVIEGDTRNWEKLF